MSNLDENELSQLASVLVALQRYDRFLPVGWNDSGTHDLIPVLDYWGRRPSVRTDCLLPKRCAVSVCSTNEPN
jgi:hypothetical protein